MSATYDLSQLTTSDLYRLRFELGDTDMDDPLLQDEEIEFCLTETASFWRAAQKAAFVIARGFSREASFSIGQLRVDLTQRAAQWMKTADEFEAQIRAEENTVGVPTATNLNTSPPDIYRGMHDYPCGGSGASSNPNWYGGCW